MKMRMEIENQVEMEMLNGEISVEEGKVENTMELKGRRTCKWKTWRTG